MSNDTLSSYIKLEYLVRDAYNSICNCSACSPCEVSSTCNRSSSHNLQINCATCSSQRSIHVPSAAEHSWFSCQVDPTQVSQLTSLIPHKSAVRAVKAECSCWCVKLPNKLISCLLGTENAYCGPENLFVKVIQAERLLSCDIYIAECAAVAGASEKFTALIINFTPSANLDEYSFREIASSWAINHDYSALASLGQITCEDLQTLIKSEPSLMQDLNRVCSNINLYRASLNLVNSARAKAEAGNEAEAVMESISSCSLYLLQKIHLFLYSLGCTSYGDVNSSVRLASKESCLLKILNTIYDSLGGDGSSVGYTSEAMKGGPVYNVGKFHVCRLYMSPGSVMDSRSSNLTEGINMEYPILTCLQSGCTNTTSKDSQSLQQMNRDKGSDLSSNLPQLCYMTRTLVESEENKRITRSVSASLRERIRTEETVVSNQPLPVLQPMQFQAGGSSSIHTHPTENLVIQPVLDSGLNNVPPVNIPIVNPTRPIPTIPITEPAPKSSPIVTNLRVGDAENSGSREFELFKAEMYQQQQNSNLILQQLVTQNMLIAKQLEQISLKQAGQSADNSPSNRSIKSKSSCEEESDPLSLDQILKKHKTLLSQVKLPIEYKGHTDARSIQVFLKEVDSKMKTELKFLPANSRAVVEKYYIMKCVDSVVMSQLEAKLKGSESVLELKSYLISRYGHAQYSRQLEQQLWQKQKPDEKISTFLDRISVAASDYSSCKGCQLDDDQLVGYAMAGMTNKFKDYAIHHDKENWVTFCTSMDSIESNLVTVKSKVLVTMTKEQKEQCNMCGGVGHNNLACTSKKQNQRSDLEKTLSCYVCGGVGHLKRDCANKKIGILLAAGADSANYLGGKIAAVNAISTSTDIQFVRTPGLGEGTRLFIKIPMMGAVKFGRFLRLLVDSGADYSSVSTMVADELIENGYAEKVECGNPVVGTAAGAVEVSIIRVKFKINNKDHILRWNVLANLDLDGLLGTNEFKLFGVAVDTKYAVKDEPLTDLSPKTFVAASKPAEELKPVVTFKVSERAVVLDHRVATLFWKDSTRPPKNLNNAITRAFKTQVSLKKIILADKSTAWDAYLKVFDVYKQFSFIKKILPSQAKHYIPHFMIYKPSSGTTPVRPVWDAVLLNMYLLQCFFKDPELQKIWLKLRLSDFWMTFDLTKAFLQLKFEAVDSAYLSFVLPEADGSVSHWQWVSLPFGLTISPSLLEANVSCIIKQILCDATNNFDKCRCLNHECANCDLNKSVLNVEIDSFVDDIFITGSRNSTVKLSAGQFNAAANHSVTKFREKCFPVDDVKIHSYLILDSPKLLGVRLNQMDSIQFDLKHVLESNVNTRRKLASMFGKLFDPLGLHGELMMKSKQVYRLTLSSGWDEQLTAEQMQSISEWTSVASRVASFSWTRRVDDTSIFVFVDASQLIGWGVDVVDAQCVRIQSKSSLWTKAQDKWTVPKKELFALHTAVMLMSKWIKANLVDPNKILFCSDSEINVARVNNKTLNSSLCKLQLKWLESILQFDPKLLHISGGWNLADGLSRAAFSAVSVEQKRLMSEFLVKFLNGECTIAVAPWKVNTQNVYAVVGNLTAVEQQSLPADSISALQVLVAENKADFEVQGLVGTTNSYIRIDGVVYAKGHPTNKLVVSHKSVYTKSLILRSHITQIGMHNSFKVTYDNLKRDYWFKNMWKKTKEIVENCDVCFRLAVAEQDNNVPADDVAEAVAAKAPFELHGVDLVGPIEVSDDHKFYILTVTDRYSRFVWLDPLVSITSLNCIKLLDKIYNDFGAPVKLITDHGLQFVSKQFIQYCKNMNIKLEHIPAYFPTYGGFYERSHSILVRAFMSIVMSHGKFKAGMDIRRAVKSIQNTMNNRLLGSSDHLTPRVILFNRQSLGVDRAVSLNKQEEADIQLVADIPIQLKPSNIMAAAEQLQIEMREKSMEAIRRKRGYRQQATVKVGDVVYTMRTMGGSKYKVPWEGPAVVVAVAGAIVSVKCEDKEKSVHRSQLIIAKELYSDPYEGA